MANGWEMGFMCLAAFAFAARSDAAVTFHTLYTDLLTMPRDGVGVMTVTTTPKLRFVAVALLPSNPHPPATSILTRAHSPIRAFVRARCFFTPPSSSQVGVLVRR